MGASRPESRNPACPWDAVAGLPAHPENDQELSQEPTMSPVCRCAFVVLNKCEGRLVKNSIRQVCRALPVCQGLLLGAGDSG